MFGDSINERMSREKVRLGNAPRLSQERIAHPVAGNHVVDDTISVLQPEGKAGLESGGISVCRGFVVSRKAKRIRIVTQSVDQFECFIDVFEIPRNFEHEILWEEGRVYTCFSPYFSELSKCGQHTSRVEFGV